MHFISRPAYWGKTSTGLAFFPVRSKSNQNPEHRKIYIAPRDHQGQCEEAECGQCTDSNPASIGADLQNVLNIDAGLRTMNHFSSVGASQPVLSGKKPDKQRPDLRSLCHEEATGRGGEPSNPIATHFLLYFCSSYSTLIYFPLVHA